MRVDLIYLNKRGSSLTNHWAYYRISSTGGSGDTIELCQVKWPTMEDITDPITPDKAVVVNVGDAGYVSAWPNMITVLLKKWDINHRDGDLIGILFDGKPDRAG